MASGTSSVDTSSSSLDNIYLPLPMHHNLADPRSSSTHSLVPSSRRGSSDSRRTLLVIYIHGFMGNNSSFRSFPAHVHNYLKETLAETHVIHTKIYPRYKTYKSIDVASENFSRWLAPHESPTTDVILVGHSMGGLLAADVVLLPSNDNSRHASPFRHRILGTISLDAPLLGLHPGIVISGIASLFRSAPTPPAVNDKPDRLPPDPKPSGRLSPDSAIYEQVRPPSNAPSPCLTPVPDEDSTYDATYNPKFFNDVAFVDRGWLKNIAHFAKKHRQENLVEAAANHIISHLEFGGCLADYPALKTRYARIRMLEDVDELIQSGNNSNNNLVRVRFVNYYTVSTGLPKKPKTPKQSLDVTRDADAKQVNNLNDALDPSLGLASPRISIEDCSSPPERHQSSARASSPSSQPLPPPPRSSSSASSSDDNNDGENEGDEHETPLELLDPIPMAENDEEKTPTPGQLPGPSPSSARPTTITPSAQHDDDNNGNDNPDWNFEVPIPPLPAPPAPPDLSSIPDKESRKAAEKEYKSAKKEYEQLVKAREKVIKSQQKAREKARKEAEKQEREFKRKQEKEEKEGIKLQEKEDKKFKKEQDKLRKQAEKEQDEKSRKEENELKKQQEQEQDQDEGEDREGNEEEEEEENKKKKKNKKLEKQQQQHEKEKKTSNKKKRLGKFCMLPSDSPNDKTWIQVYMKDMDEVTAHCGLFFADRGPDYERLVGDVAERIVKWVEEDGSRRVLLEEMERVD